MESVAPPGGVMLSESTARLVEDAVVLGEPELVHIKGADTPVPARRLLAIGEHQAESAQRVGLVGRTWEMNTVDRDPREAIGGAGCVVNIMGPPGIGKSRLVRETAAIAASRGVRCSRPTASPTPATSRFMWWPGCCARHSGLTSSTRGGPGTPRDQVPDADAEDLLLLDDLLGIRDPEVALPDIAPMRGVDG